MKKTLFFISLFIGFCSGAQTIIRNVDADTFKRYVLENKYMLIDLRTNDEISRKGMIKGALQIDYFNENAASEIAKLDKSKTVLIYCAGGGRSTECAELMSKNGFKEVINLEKGFDDWKRKGLEIHSK